MCQFAAYLGPDAPLSTLLHDAPRSLERLSYDPRDQVAGHVNVDGTGIAWWPEGERMPMRYVTVQPPWSDANLPALSRRLRGRAHLAAVRSATPGIPIGPGNVHPFEYSRHAFAHQGALGRFREATGRPLLQALPDGLHAAIDAVSDSLVLFLTVMRHLEASEGAGMEAAMAATVRDALAVTAAHRAPAALNMITCDGERIVATRCARGRPSSPLHVLDGGARWPGARLVATEPLDDDPGWRAVPDDHLLVVDGAGVSMTPLDLGEA